MPSPRTILKAMRPAQWTKNAVVLAAFFFGFWDRTQPEPLVWTDIFVVIPAALLFCLASSGIYILNDIRDIEADRHHPVKRHRPIASGALTTSVAWTLAGVLLAIALVGALVLAPLFALALVSYLAIQVVYTFGLKRIALVDVMVIAVGFVIRAISGAVVFESVRISPWLLLCTFLLALFLALCKRRHEKLLTPDTPGQKHRPSLEKYDARLLDQLIAVTAGATIVSYAIYTLWPETVAKFGTDTLGFTIPFVVFGVFRYLDLAYRQELGGRPEKVLLTDLPMMVNLGLYGLTLLVVFLLPH